MEVEGIVKNIIYENKDNNYRVLNLETSDGEITAVGNIRPVINGEAVKITGDIYYHDKFGEQIKIETLESIKGTSTISIEKYLASAGIPHIGATMAKRIVDKFGEDTLDILKNNPSRFLEVEGIGNKKYQDIKESLEETLKNQELFMFLQSLGITMNQAARIIDKYGDDTKENIETNPYRLIDDIWGIGFKTADEIALRNDIELDSKFRIKAAYTYFLQTEASQNGNCYMPYELTVEKVSKLLNLDRETVEEPIMDFIVEGVILVEEVEGEKIVYEPYLYDSEVAVAGKLAQIICDENAFKDINVEREVEKLKNLKDITLADEQILAIETVLKENITIITGGPGTGKTTIINHIVEIFKSNGQKVILGAPTGRAAKRLEESCGVKAKTIHRLLGYMPLENKRAMIFEHDEDNPLDGDVIIIDEASMLDLELCENLLKGISTDMRIVFVGDVDQLPSVGAGNVLNDMIESGYIKTIKLNKIFRQEDSSNIVINAHRINNGEVPIINEKGKDFFFLREFNTKNMQKRILELVAKRLPNYYKFNSTEDIQVLTPMKKGDIGTVELNNSLQEVLNPKTPSKDEIMQGGRIFRVDDKVMQIKNNYNKTYKSLYGQEGQGVFNGDFGRVSKVDSLDETLEVILDEDKRIEYSKKELDELQHSYAITIHKSQGSEFPAVVIPIGPGPYMLMTRNLIYTAITRAKKLVVLVGDYKYLNMMIKNNHIEKRNSTLNYRIKEYYELYKGMFSDD